MLRMMVNGLILAALCIAGQTAMAQRWTDMAAGLENVRVLTTNADGTLYAGGDSGVTRWNGWAWTNLCGFVSIYSLAVAVDGSLYVGGEFSGLGGAPATNIAKWNGSTWTNLGSGISDGFYDYVSSLAIAPNGDLYAAGCFTTAGGVPAKNVARWNGSTWTNLGPGLDDDVYALAVGTNGELYAGGHFMKSGLEDVEHLGKWNGSVWTNIGFGDDIQAVVVATNGQLYAGGNAGLWKWNGAAWTNLGGTMDGAVNALVLATNGELYAAGSFSTIRGVSAESVARWNGTSWTNLGTGVPLSVFENVYALALGRRGEVFVGGDFFVTIGTVDAENVAQWIIPPSIRVVGIDAGEIVNEEPPALENGTDLGMRATGNDTSNTLSILNVGVQTLKITGATTNGMGAAHFAVSGLPSVIGPDCTNPFSVTFRPTGVGTHTAAVAIAHNSSSTPFILNLRGVCFPDVDGDGLSDNWEIQHFQSTNAVNGDAMQDCDGDGVANISEFRAGTDPTNRASLLRMSNLTLGATSNVVVQWSSASNRSYILLWTTNMQSGWDAKGTVFSATPPCNTYTDSPTTRAGFYKIRVP